MRTPGQIAYEAFLPEPKHEDGCPAIADDESDYEYLSDAGECVCKLGWERLDPALKLRWEEAAKEVIEYFCDYPSDIR